MDKQKTTLIYLEYLNPKQLFRLMLKPISKASANVAVLDPLTRCLPGETALLLLKLELVVNRHFLDMSPETFRTEK